MEVCRGRGVVRVAYWLTIHHRGESLLVQLSLLGASTLTCLQN